jgi:thioredoxin 2
MSETVHVVCAECNTTNRIPALHDNKEMNCGRCHKPLFGAVPRSLDATGLQAQITQSEIPVIVDFWAPWCGPCKAMAPAFEQASLMLGSRAHLVKVNTEEQQALGSQYSIRSIPTVAIFKGGRELARRSGAVSATDLLSWAHSVGV